MGRFKVRNEAGLNSVAHTASDNSHSERLGMGLGNGLVLFSDSKRGELGSESQGVLHSMSIDVNLCTENSVHSLG